MRRVPTLGDSVLLPRNLGPVRNSVDVSKNFRIEGSMELSIDQSELPSNLIDNTLNNDVIMRTIVPLLVDCLRA